MPTPRGVTTQGPPQEGSLVCLPREGSQLKALVTFFLFFQSKELKTRHHRGLQATLAMPLQDLSVLMEEAEAALTGGFIRSYCASF